MTEIDVTPTREARASSVSSDDEKKDSFAGDKPEVTTIGYDQALANRNASAEAEVLPSNWFLRLFASTAKGDHAARQRELDEGARILREAGDIDWDKVTPEEYNNVRKKIDRNLMPMMMALYLIQFAVSPSGSVGTSSETV